ncbi:hypothetical protein MYX82_10440 [Acidobacteria bacterium AH-259-D05]|nr:hypothetical protein [Acidobacteria bacterium AH-259-D05]
MRDERGVALMIVIIVSILLALLGLSMTYTSMSEFSMNNELEKKNMAFTSADAGFNALKDSLRGNEISDILATTASVPRYTDYTEPDPDTQSDAFQYFSRNPLAPLEAMNVDFDNPPTPIGTRTVNGLLTPAAGTTLGTGGRYWAKITDNKDEAPLGSSDDPLVDQDGTIYLRVMGIQRVGAGQISTYGGTVKNSVAILETKLERDMTLDLSAPFTRYGAMVTPVQNKLFNVNNFTLDGYNHIGMTLQNLIDGTDVHTTGGNTAAIDVLNTPDATAIRDAIYNGLLGPPDKRSQLVGDMSDYPGPGPGPGEPSLRDATALVQGDPNEDAQNIFDPNYIMNFVLRVKTVADVVLANRENYNQDLGDDGSVGSGSPQITYCVGDCSIGGTGHGAGLLIVRGELEFAGNRSHRGLVLVVGEGEFSTRGSNSGILGGLFVAKIIGPDAGGNYSYGDPKFTLNGTTKIYYQGSGIRLGYSLLPMKNIVWREITPEIEPPY